MVSGTIVGVLVMVVGALISGYGVYNYRLQKREITNSTSVQGRITKIDIEEHSYSEGTSYEPHVEYEYEYQGDSYTGEDLYPGTMDASRNSEKKAREVVDEFTEDAPVTLYVDEDNPARSFVFRDTQSVRIWGGILAGIVFIGFGLLIAF